MATVAHSESRSLYSWWWDSHISPKNSKWLQENLTDMDAKIKAMIKLIEEDADSFARRAEMFYKKRPELMKLVEEFYRAYRALAERYDHATVELRHAHRTMAEAFPNQVPYVLEDDSPSSSPGPGAEPHTPEMLLPIRALLDSASKESNSDTSQRDLKQHNDMFGCVVPQHSKLAEGKGINIHEAEGIEQSFQDRSSQLSSEIQEIKTQVLSGFKRAGTAEIEVQTLKKTVVEMQAEKEAALLQYQQCLEKLSNLERELNHAQKDVRELDGRASKDEIEIKILKEALEKLKAERDASLLQYSQCLKRISSLENMIFLAPEDAKALNERAVKAENETENLKQELSKLEAEKEAGLLQYKQCREKISVLENKISLAEENAKMLNEQSERAETEVKALKEAVAKLNEEREFAALKYDQCLETIAKKESEISHAREDAKRLNSEILIGAAKLESAEAQYVLLEQSHQSLRLEADNLAQKIAMKDQELSEKHDELQKLQLLVQEEHSQFLQVEATLQTMQKLHSQSQDEQRDLVLELKNGLQTLKDLEMCRQCLEKEIHQVKEENCSLNELNFSSTVSIKNLQDEIFSLKETKEKLDDQVAVQVDQSNALQQEIFHLKKEIGDLNRRYRALMEQVESVGLNPECLDSSVKDLQDENSKLKEVCKRDRDEREALYEKLKNMEELSKKNAVLDSSLSELYGKLEGAQEKVEELQGSCQLLQGEKSTFVSEKATMVSQLHIITENMQKLLENNTFLEDSLSGANVELEVLRTKSKSLEELCQLLNNEKSNLLIERDTLASQLGNAEQRQGNLEKRFTKLEEKYAGLEKEKDSTLCQLEELRGSLGAEKQKHADFMHSSEARMAGLENRVPLLPGESRLTRKFFEEELNKAVNDQIEMFLLQKFVDDLEEQNFSLLIDCQRHVEASKLSDKLISELESENLEQQVEAEFLLDDLERLRKGIHQVFQALQIEPHNGHEKVEQEQTLLPQILNNVENLKGEILRNKDEKQQLLIENSVLLTLLEQLKIESAELESENRILEQKCKMTTEQCSILQNDKCELLEMNRQLRLEVIEGDQRGEVLKAEMGSLRMELLSSQRACMVVQEEKLTVLEENVSLLKGISDLKQEKDLLKEENGAFLYEAVAFEYLSFVSKSFGNEKVAELKAVTEDLNSLHLMNSDLKEEVGILEEKLQMKETENLHLSESFQKTDKELHEVKDSNDQLSHQIIIENEFLRQKAMELSEAEQKLRTSQNLSMELSRTIEQLKRELEESKLLGENAEKQILELSENNTNQSKEMECLLNVNENLVSELGILHKEIEEHRIREENLSSDLRERSNEFELWEAEAATFFFDFQISAVHEVLLENKVQELTRVCESLEGISATESVETEKMKERVGFLESEIGGLKAQLFAYAPVIASLRDDIASLEHNALLRTKLLAEDNQEQQGVETAVHHGKSYQEVREDQSAAIQDGISDLQKMQARVKAVERAVVEEMELLAKHEGVNTTISLEPAVKETERLNSKCLSQRDQDIAEEQIGIGDEPTDDYPKSQKPKPGVPAARNGILMKDIQLDQVSDCLSYKTSKRRDDGAGDQIIELRETDEQDYNPDPTVNETQKEASVPSEDGIICCQFEDVEHKSQDLSSELQIEKELGVDMMEVSTTSVVEPNLEGNKRKFLERLASDAQKLTSLQTTVQELKRKTEMNKKSENAKDAKYESVKRQLQEVEEAVLQLVDVNNQLTKDVEESPSYLNGKTSVEVEEARNVDRKRVTERARGGSEKIGRLQFEVQNIQYVLLKLEDAKKSSESRTSIRLRDFISSSRRIGKRREKGRFCWCMKPSTNGD